jgi:hypothetical protein
MYCCQVGSVMNVVASSSRICSMGSRQHSRRAARTLPLVSVLGLTMQMLLSACCLPGCAKSCCCCPATALLPAEPYCGKRGLVRELLCAMLGAACWFGLAWVVL